MALGTVHTCLGRFRCGISRMHMTLSTQQKITLLNHSPSPDLAIHYTLRAGTTETTAFREDFHDH